MKKNGKSAIRIIMISGGNRGICRAIAEDLFNENYRLSLGFRKPEELSRTFTSEAETKFFVKSMLPEIVIMLNSGLM